MRQDATARPEIPWWGILFPLLTTCCTAIGFGMGARATSPPPDLRLFRDVRRLVMDGFVEPRTGQELLYSGLQGMLSSLDGHSAFYPPREAKIVEDETEGRYEGIGVVTAPAAPALTVLFPLPGSPAEAAGIQPGDRILAADGAVLADLDEADRLGRIKGPAGTRVRLTLRRGEAPDLEVEVERASVPTTSVSRSRLLPGRIPVAYLAVREFQAHTVADVDRAWEALSRAGARALVLDLRFNGGGLLHSAQLLVNRFCPREGLGLVRVHARNRRNSHDYVARAAEARLADVPLAVLVNRSSASSAEIFAAAVQDLCRAPLVGTLTFGKGTVQVVQTLAPEMVKVKYTTARYVTAGGLLVEPTTEEARAGAPGGVVPDLPAAMGRDGERALLAWLQGWDPPETLRPRVEEVRRSLGLPAEDPPADPQLDQAWRLLQGENPWLGGEAASRPGRAEQGSREER